MSKFSVGRSMLSMTIESTEFMNSFFPTMLRAAWNEIQPSTELRDGAEHLLGLHKLRAADARQLSAALIWCRNRPRGRPFVLSDDLADAAEAEGFMVVGVPGCRDPKNRSFPGRRHLS